MTGISVQAKIMFTKAEKAFREFLAKNNPQNIDCKTMVDSLMSNVEDNIATQLMENEDEEGLLYVVETRFLLYLRVRSFSHVRDVASQKKKEKKDAG